MAAHNPIVVFRGENVIVTWTMSPLTDITNWTLSYELRHSLDEAVLLTIAGVVVTPASGIYSVTFTAAQLNITPDIYVYSVSRTDFGSVAILSEGPFVVKRSAHLP